MSRGRILAGAELIKEEDIASLWSGYGKIIRLTYTLADGSPLPIIKKQVSLGIVTSSTQQDASHCRKAVSYSIERWFYSHLSAGLCETGAKVPRIYEITKDAMLLEDLSVQYPLEHVTMNLERSLTVVSWLAAFHAHFWTSAASSALKTVPLGAVQTREGVWEEGGYWPLRTRLEEFQTLSPIWQEAAKQIDLDIRAVPNHLTTLLHGDLKAANIMFSRNFADCAAFDFQYVGNGPGMRDLVYFMISSVAGLNQTMANTLVTRYHALLQELLEEKGQHGAAKAYTFEIMMEHYDLCMADYYRFMLGWVSRRRAVEAKSAKFLVADGNQGMWGNYRFAKDHVDPFLNRRGMSV